MKLSPSDHYLWLVLQRVNTSRMTTRDGRYFDRGAPAGTLMADILDDLLLDGVVTPAAPSPHDGLARLALTTTGAAHYRSLCRAQRARPPTPPPDPDHPNGTH